MLSRIAILLEALALFLRKFERAWRYYRKLNYTWRLSWAKAGWQICD